MRLLPAAIFLGALAASGEAGASEESDALFAHGVAALESGHPAAAIADFEALADRGVIDANASYDRGAAYAMRVRVGGEQAGDQGRAAQGFEEARALTGDALLDRDASLALDVVRAEVARRRARAGEPVEIDPGVPTLRAIAGWLDEDTWLMLGAAASLLLAAGLFARRAARSSRLRVSSAIVVIGSALLLTGALVFKTRARSDRLGLREAVIVASGARPCDEHGIAITGAAPLPEAARVELLDAESGALSHVRFGAIQTRIPSGTLRGIARPE